MIDDEKIRLQELSYKWLNGTLTDTEQLEFDLWFVHSKIGPLEVPAEVAEDKEQYRQLIFSRIREEIGLAKPAKRTKLLPRIAGIAAAVIGLALCVYFFTTPRHPDTSLSSRANAKDLNDIAPGGNRATLTFANGNKINLSDKKNGVIVGDALKYDDNTLVIQSDSEGSGSRGYEGPITAVTPRGGMYSIILQDGTKVWLNADSKLEFFSNYRNKLQRIVKLIAGEAYFEVAKNRAKPFIVESNGQRIEVLGTHFNVSAYTDDIGIRTTLLEGIVRVFPTLSSRARTLSSRANAKDLDPSELGMTKGREGMPKRRDSEAVTLKPNQQSLVTANQRITIKQVDAAAAIDWKDGKFVFESEALGTIMKKVARWYNVEIIYKDDMANAKVTGSISRYGEVSQLLNMLETTGGVHFKIEGRIIYVTK